MLKVFILLFYIFCLFSCSFQLPEGIKTKNITHIDYEGKNVYFGDNENNSILIPFNLLEQRYIPENISVIHLGYGLSEEEIIKIFQYNLNFIEKPQINFWDNALTEEIHNMFSQLDIQEFNGSLLVYDNCDKPIIIPKKSSDKYFNSQIEKFDIYATCKSNVMTPIDCKFEGYDRDSEKLICG